MPPMPPYYDRETESTAHQKDVVASSGASLPAGEDTDQSQRPHPGASAPTAPPHRKTLTLKKPR